MNTDIINYERIAKAQFYYRALGYENVETPWAVSQQAIRATLPIPNTMIESTLGFLVGSGEQSFIQQMIDGQLRPGKYQTTVPCFRHLVHGMDRHTSVRTELIWYTPDDPRSAYEVVLNAALSCFFAISDVDTFDATPTGDGFDICFAGTPLGSYGVRRLGEHVWVYGTGLAEPLFSSAIRRIPQVVPPDSLDSGEIESALASSAV